MESPSDFDTIAFGKVLTRRMIVVPSFEIHGGTAGLFDLGPVGCCIKNNIIDVWKKHFILKERMLQIESTCITPENVLRVSGHVARFSDFMVKDLKTKKCYRADKLLEDHIEMLIKTNPDMDQYEKEQLEKIAIQADAYSQEELNQQLLKFEIKAPETGNDLGEPYPFNLMFKSSIGPEGHQVGYLRPETAQGIFVNFKRLLEFKNGKLPFSAAQIGLGFRNEIAPRNGLIRVREFTMAEIEHFVEPEKKDHPNFKEIELQVLTLFPRVNQLSTNNTVKMSTREAVEAGIISNQTLAYFMVRTHQFLEKIGIDMEKVRFRQHLSTEMAHYASDCWDAEIKLSMGWVECVGHADRSCYDLEVHSKATKIDLTASRRVIPPKIEESVKIVPNKRVLGKLFNRDSVILMQFLENADASTIDEIERKLSQEGTVSLEIEDKFFELTPSSVKIKRIEKTIYEERFFPSVIEPSFGIGRILHAVLEHNFYKRKHNAKKSKKEKIERTVFSFNPLISAIKCGVITLCRNSSIEKYAQVISDKLIEINIHSTYDISSVSVGKKYSRLDEIGVPFIITVDTLTLEDNQVTLRERDSQQQIRISISDIYSTVSLLCNKISNWEEIHDKYAEI